MRPSMVREMVAAAGVRPLLALSGGLPPAEAFPAEELAAAAARLLASGDPAVLQYSATEGDPILVELLAASLEAQAVPGQVLVTTGSQQALDLVGKVLLDPGDVAVVECPTYVGALRALAVYQPRFVSVPVDDDGMDTAALEALLVGGLRPKLCYLVPNFSNPSGATLSAPRRAHLARLSAEHGFLVVEDDPYGQLRFHGEHVAPVASHAGGDVLYLGSFSKVIAPGLRVGYAAVPDWLMRSMTLAKQATDLNSSSFSQRLVAELLAQDGWLDGHVTRLQDLYRRRATTLVDALDPRVRTRLPDGGMFLWGTVAVDALALTNACLARDVAIVPGTEFALEPGYERTVRLSFSTLSEDELRESATRMALALDDLA
ncbi:MAG: aspartate aminotransferase [Actinomycetia bacterium]|nr:aspartate aminotransferase [Actinomycetes bacterium]